MRKRRAVLAITVAAVVVLVFVGLYFGGDQVQGFGPLPTLAS